MCKKILVFLLMLILFTFTLNPALAVWHSRQDTAHEIAELARSIGLPEDDPIIRRAQEIWWEDYYISQLPIRQADVEALAKTMWGEAGSIDSKMEQAAVAWCVLNRVDAEGFGNSIISVITAPNQFLGYKASFPVKPELEELARDVLIRWYREKNGETDVGRVLPKDYCWFWGDGKHNHFRNKYVTSERWDWSLPDPYK